MNTKFNQVLHFDPSYPLNWSTILAGAFIALALQSLFNLLAVGVGFFSFNMDIDSITSLGWVSFGWIMITGIVSMFLGSWISARTCGASTGGNGVYQGLASWSIATLLIFSLLSTSAGIFIGGTASMIDQQLDNTQENVTKHKFDTYTEPKTAYTEENDTPPSSISYTTGSTRHDKEKAAKAVGSIALITTLTFFLSGIASIIGGFRGAQSNQRNHGRHSSR